MKTSKPTSTSTLTPQYLLAGSLSAVLGDAVAFPLDTIKVRMQANPARSMKGAWTAIIREGGIACIFRGIGASAFRQSTYGGTRMFLYTPICNAISSQATTSGLHVQICAGALSGCARCSTRSSPRTLVRTRWRKACCAPSWRSGTSPTCSRRRASGSATAPGPWARRPWALKHTICTICEVQRAYKHKTCKNCGAECKFFGTLSSHIQSNH